MKKRNVPKHLANVPNGYEFDAGDKKAIKKYREEKKVKERKRRVELCLENVT